MIAARRIRDVVLTLSLGAVLAACSGPADTTDAGGSDSKEKDTNASAAVDSVLVIDGKQVGPDGAVASDPTLDRAKAASKRARTRTTATTDEVEWPAPQLNADGTINDGPDPFQGERIQVQPLPIEDDPSTTASIDAAAMQMRRLDRADWDRWIGANNQRSPWAQGDDPFASALVDITVERCGGARTVATGVVLAEETVVTTVHAVETASKRVRVSSTVGEGPRLAAMIRYLDVDDDVAVLKVPGLKIQPMPMYAPSGTAPRLGYAYGVANVGVAGSMRRTPVMVSMQEATIEAEQPDGFAEQISDRSVQTLVGGISTGFSGGVVATTNDPKLSTGFGFHGLIRARVPFRADTAGIVVPSRIVRDAISASGQLDTWFEHRPGGCPQWGR
ncbi:MAG: hypothetical protein JWL76_984 [Thermoleophilia bacterium]|nr:hypothetical protein [Thermoleophilia bacterium]